MVSDLIYAPIAIAVVLVLVFLVPVLLNRGKWLKCPDCGEVFKAPAMDQRYTGIGLSPPGLGRVKCPKCGELRSRRDYQKAQSPGTGVK